MELALSPVEKILKKTNLRISDKAVKEFAMLLEETISDIAAEAATNAKRNNRKTVLVEDVRAAMRKIL